MNKNRKFFKTATRVLSIFALMLFAFSMTLVYARTEDVPSSWLNARSNLLRRRDSLQELKAEQMRCWTEDENTLKILDQYMVMPLSAENRRSVVGSRAARMSCISSHKAVTCSAEREIIDIDQSIASIEREITNVACRR